jgi:benzodiazapine receptor
MSACTLNRYEPAAGYATRTWAGVGVFLAACFGVAAVGGLITAASVNDWYRDLHKPVFTPPDWVFGPVWTVLYLMMAAAGLVWAARDREDVCCPLAAFGLQLAANFMWTVLFFGLHRPFLAFLDLLVLWVLVGITTLHFFEASRPAGWLMVPYWIWVSYAAVLNLAILALSGP